MTVDKKQKEQAIEGLMALTSFMTTMSYLVVNDQNQHFNITLNDEKAISNFEFVDIIMENRFKESALNAIQKDGIFVAMEKSNSEGFGTIDAISIDEFALLVSTLAILAGNKSELAYYGQTISPTVNILVAATKRNLKSKLEKQALSAAQTTALEITTQMSQLKDKNSK